ncbi:MAG: hypothetical protein ACKO0V_16330 [bacterium]
MTQPLTQCPYCHKKIEILDRSQFRFICQSCGRAFMARDWHEVIGDSEPSVIFEPLAGSSLSTKTSGFSIRKYFRIIAQRTTTAKGQVLRLIMFSGLFCSVAAGLATEWYRPSDIWVSGLMGLLLSSFILIMPEIMIAIGTGAITAIFCSVTFVPFTFNGMPFFLYFLFGFVFSIFLQFAKRNLQPNGLNSSNRNARIDTGDFDSR